MNVLVLIPYLYDTVPGQRFRIEQWARELEPCGVRFHFSTFESPELKRVMYAHGQYASKIAEVVRCTWQQIGLLAGLSAEYDVVFLFRQLLPVGPPLLERILARKGIPIVYDFDDAIFLPDVSDVNRRFAWLKWPSKTGDICRLSTHVTVGNEYLKDYVLRYTDRVSVVPTTIDTRTYVPKEDVGILGLPTIGWSGSMTTVKHLRTLEDTFKTLAKSLQFKLKVVGAQDYNIPGLDVTSRPWSAQSEVEDIKSFDIGLMPLPDDPWARGKCGLKALQYMAAGVPTITSPVGVNAEIIRDGVNGFLASSPEEWMDKISRLVSDTALRSQFSKEGRRTVEERYSAIAQAPRLLEILGAAKERRPVCAA